MYNNFRFAYVRATRLHDLLCPLAMQPDALTTIYSSEVIDIHYLRYKDWKSSSAPLVVDWFWTETSVEQF